MKSTIAIAYDFDGTLAPGNMQEHSFIPKLGIDKSAFWEEANRIASDNDADEILTYMQLMLKKAAEKNIPITRKAFMELGNEIQFFKGVESWFERINTFGASLSINVEHYIISSGVRDIVYGTSIAKYFKNIFASGYIFDANDVAIWPALAINYTTKTQYLFRINKGINNSFDNSQINRFIPYDERPVPFSNMIYIGDGETDVPAMKMIKYQGGTAIAAYNPENKSRPGKPTPKEICEKLIADHRADFIAPADYSENSKLDAILKTLMRRIAEEEKLEKFK
ncbi:MAG: haloacid dehalogenase-like hydrolase [Bacteroidales bacterium]|nr:haloacid dehalogenase-like hydrolase [Bacteroidales bacterium]